MGVMDDAMGNGFAGEKTHFRFDDGYEDPGDGTLASYIAVTDTSPIVLGPNSRFRLRWSVARQDTTLNWQFEFQKRRNQQAPWGVVTLNSNAVHLVASNWITDRDHVTEYTGGSGDPDEQLYSGAWADATNFAVLTDNADAETGASTWSSGSAKGMSLEAMFMLSSDLKPGEEVEIRPQVLGQAFTLGYDIIPLIQVGRRIYSTS